MNGYVFANLIILLLVPGKVRAAVNRSLVAHCDAKHQGKIQHHFTPPKMRLSLWAWEMTVRYVAQVLVESSLLKVGLDKGIFEALVCGGNNAFLLAQIGAILGGAIAATTDNIFNGRLIGYKYAPPCGLYLPGLVNPGTMPSPEQLACLRKNALAKVEARAKDWIRDCLLPEMLAFDYTTMVNAMRNTEVPKDQYGGYLWNAIGMFFRRGICAYNGVFPPAETALLNERCEYTMWDALEEEFEREEMITGPEIHLAGMKKSGVSR